MTRKKVQMAYIACDSARKATYKKRKKGLLKKIDELTTLCGVEACAVLYSPFEHEAVVWPNREKGRMVVERFRQLPEMDQYRKMYDHPAYLRQRVNKASQQLARLQRDNREREVMLAIRGCLAGIRGLEGLTLVDLNDLGWMVERTLKEVNLRLQKLSRQRTNGNNRNGRRNSRNAVVSGEPQAVARDRNPSLNFPPFLMGPPPLPLPPPPGFFRVRGDEVGPGMGQFLGLGFGNFNNMQMQVVGPNMWPMGQYYPVAFSGASGSVGGENMSAAFAAFFR